MNRKIRKLRDKVDKIDEELVELVIRREKVTASMAKQKQDLGIPVKDPDREKEIIDKLRAKYSSDIDNDLIERLYKEIFKHSKEKSVRENDKPEKQTVHEALKERPIIIAGPCVVESKEQINTIGQMLCKIDGGIKFLRGGAFKPRTSPKSFQGLGIDGLKYIREAADANNMFVVSELLETEQLESCYDYVDIIQIGSRNMTSYGFLKAVGKRTAEDKKPVLLKRGFSSIINELLCAAEYILEKGNPNVLLCLRGIRTFEQIDSEFRFTPDLASIIELKEKTNLPVIFDPSHSTGNTKYVADIIKAAVVLGADGLMIECHHKQAEAQSDGQQSIHPDELDKILKIISVLH